MCASTTKSGPRGYGKNAKQSTARSNFSFAGRRPHVVGWDQKTQWVDVVRNYRGKPIVFELRRQWPGHVDYTSEIATKLFDFQTTETKLTVAARGRQAYPCTVVLHLGTHQKQNRIDLR